MGTSAKQASAPRILDPCVANPGSAQSRSIGLLSPSLQSNDGGFGFQGPSDQSFTGAKAGAYRADLSVGLRDFFEGRDGRFTFYKQHLDAGYSSPGQATIKDTEQYGGTFRMP